MLLPGIFHSATGKQKTDKLEFGGPAEKHRRGRVSRPPEFRDLNGRDGKPVPYEWMTINSPKFDEDSHKVVRCFIAMTGNSTISNFSVRFPTA